MKQDINSPATSVHFPLKAYTVKQLSELYGVSPKTFHRWIAPFLEDIGEKKGYFYTISQVKTILKHLGVPGTFIVE